MPIVTGHKRLILVPCTKDWLQRIVSPSQNLLGSFLKSPLVYDCCRFRGDAVFQCCRFRGNTYFRGNAVSAFSTLDRQWRHKNAAEIQKADEQQIMVRHVVHESVLDNIIRTTLEEGRRKVEALTHQRDALMVEKARAEATGNEVELRGINASLQVVDQQMQKAEATNKKYIRGFTWILCFLTIALVIVFVGFFLFGDEISDFFGDEISDLF